MISRDSWLTFFTCVAFGMIIFGDTIRYPEVQGQGFGQGPAFYPQILGGTLVVLSVLVLFQNLGRRKKAAMSPDISGNSFPKSQYSQVVKMLALCIVLILAMKYLGFFVSGFILTFMSVLLIRKSIKKRHLALDLVFSVGIIVLVYLVFEVFVGIELPTSIFFD